VTYADGCVQNIDLSAVTSQLLSTATHSYSSFQSAVSEAIRGESALQQIACMFHLSRAAIEYAGTGTSLAIRIKDMTIRYFEQYFAPWVVEQGGWVSLPKHYFLQCSFLSVLYSMLTVVGAIDAAELGPFKK